ncbi:exosortase system-associated protein, TIGR04073 family [Geomonas subterranea]|uniref:Exosortase system-associated protein, TIGR04073 family n=1 Tax=Geomonas subterranea TaxID=2847989 RepID=A0ABX8LCY9_9BACT|nr:MULTISPECIES: exosortase system-associated protein, TIGR04073 family [Geomonas]QXE89900.1 exosortase system-associated protein, TIGR04073 family [Geomonas subterranea]QXM07981.1 exosortase system-associated protein, TIGR04073 family [Geomonas subterranea]
MRTKATLLSLLLLMVFATSSFALEGQQPEAIAEKMAFKLVRGVTNTVTSVAEVPKQSYLMVRDRGGIGYVVGPLKGVGMAFYRLLTGLTETVFFAVPQPGYYDPLITPEYVWEGWEEKRVEPRGQSEAQPVQAKGE